MVGKKSGEAARSLAASGAEATADDATGEAAHAAGGTLRNVVRWVLGGFLTFAGTSHLTIGREEFQAQVPEWVPVDQDLVVLGSGFAEIALGLALLSGRKRPQVGWVTAAFFVAIFPGNIAQYLEGTDGFGLDTDQARFVRLFFQPVLVAWALWSTGAWRTWRARRR
ncbi:hypothetical protein GCM10011354_03370 [Egicoccus halophilus]|uniref:Methylamine utilisation protein MauE domain-containing protein n=1 Tax=Egicoccus halophilus TaxID=1670830 RepID=A0A8J3ABJ8_9ACTN|nr:MauE/DoxX family redox-associated membrane protein [Egicoccus halophilus]GGI03305.1 hypothetical protein GCM10011354_03370 [Egicoccus halophilus]